MKVQESHIVQSAGEMIRERMAQLGISQVELANRCGEHVQTISAVLKGQRDITIPLSVKIDAALGFEIGTIAFAQAKHQVSMEIHRQKVQDMQSRRMAILEKIKAAGGLWSYQGIPEHLDDDSIIEAALVHMDLEDMPMLLSIWSKSHLKRVWKERLVSQGKRMNILNYILAVKLFGVKHPDKYLARYAY
ncbi:MAG: helix-turn-helix transcriptional regulator [Bacteroidales bacterium]|nr:helix-turn-helix transcriptional regulator [Bacteroidales bacterium]